MNVLVLGGNGMMGPWVIKALQGRHRLRVTDINDAPAGLTHEYVRLDVADMEGMLRAAEGMDAIANLSVLRPHRKIAFDVNTRGNYNLAVAAVKHGIRRVINTGPHFQLAGRQYEDWDFDLNPDMPPQPGTRLYALTKALGQEILKVFAERHDMYLQTLLFYNMRMTETLRGPGGQQAGPVTGVDMTPFTIAWPDTGTAIRAALEVELARLPSRCETYFVFPDIPHHKFRNEKIRRVLGWSPRYQLEPLWNKAPNP
jgi:nucleoside-diphosphate-sugar epimerase